MGWNREYDEGEQITAYPYIYWINDPNRLSPRPENGRGGFAADVDQGARPEDAAPRNYTHSNGQSEVYFTQEIQAAVIRTRFAWFQEGVRLDNYAPGARGKTQAVCFVKGVDGLILLTFSGMVSKEFGNCRKQFIAAVRGATKGKAPSYAFWMTLTADGTKLVGKGNQKSSISTMGVSTDLEPDRDYIGDDLVDSIPWDELESWEAAWKNTPTTQQLTTGTSGSNGTGAGGNGSNGNGSGQTANGAAELEWAKNFPNPINKKPLVDCDVDTWLYFAENGTLPEAQKAARILLEHMPVGDEIPF